MTSQLAGIHATIAACFNCGLSNDKIAAKLVAKYGVEQPKALRLVVATREVVEG